MKIRLIILFVFIPVIYGQTGPAKELHRNPPRAWALTNATVHTSPGKTLYDGTVVLRLSLIHI